MRESIASNRATFKYQRRDAVAERFQVLRGHASVGGAHQALLKLQQAMVDAVHAHQSDPVRLERFFAAVDLLRENLNRSSLDAGLLCSASEAECRVQQAITVFLADGAPANRDALIRAVDVVRGRELQLKGALTGAAK
ncbi:MAG TPA: hypothetical protein VGM20_04225 [Gemmatimonadales bacterium]|jgi:hypothetical protein